MLPGKLSIVFMTQRGLFIPFSPIDKNFYEKCVRFSRFRQTK